MSFAKRLRELRLAKELSRERLAELSGLGRGTVRDYEQGLREPTLRSAFKLADILGVPVEDFKNGDIEEEQPPAEKKPMGRPKKSPPDAGNEHTTQALARALVVPIEDAKNDDEKEQPPSAAKPPGRPRKPSPAPATGRAASQASEDTGTAKKPARGKRKGKGE